MPEGVIELPKAEVKTEERGGEGPAGSKPHAIPAVVPVPAPAPEASVETGKVEEKAEHPNNP